MKSLSSVGLGLSIVFGSLMLALVAELYYLIWWKKRLTSKRDFFYMFCLKPSSSSSTSTSSMAHSALNLQEIRITMDESQQEQSHLFHHLQSKLKPFDRPPRFLFTIVEETMEDLDQCEEEKSKAKFGSMILSVETPYLTPIASPPFFTPPHTPPLNPLFESASDAHFNRSIRSSPSSSPPLKLKFLKEAEEKLHKRMLMEEMAADDDDDINSGFDGGEESGDMTPPSKYLKDEEDESFITINVDRSKGGFVNQQQQFHSGYASLVLPLSSSPSTLNSPDI
ncbi:putative RING/U-box superfamily protein [Hibiscus syriacus]|uniref:RING/U-box superfamily protein n=1 Tax=Hibiscus syriacus TaxID=106335 RepID=A0A6A2Z1C1_HIBSY|nr:putative RING/U-box superfamily protein [Hibiscus syriacus]